MGRCKFDASRRRKKALNRSRDKKRKARAVVGKGGKSLLCGPGTEVRLGGRTRRAKIMHGLAKKNEKAKRWYSSRF